MQNRAKRAGMEFLALPVRQINIPGKLFTIGISPTREENLGITSGQVNLASLLGDEQMETLILALMLARLSLVEMDGLRKVKKAIFLHPETFSLLAAVKKAYEYFISSSGNEEAIDVEWRAVSNASESIDAVDGLASHDIFADLYVDAFLDTPRLLTEYMDKLHGEKKGKFILIFRFSRKKLVITKRSDVEVIIDARKNKAATFGLNPLNIQDDKMLREFGKFKVNGKNGGLRIDYRLRYPYFITRA